MSVISVKHTAFMKEHLAILSETFNEICAPTNQLRLMVGHHLVKDVVASLIWKLE